MKLTLLMTPVVLLLILASAHAAPKLTAVNPSYNFGSLTQGEKLDHIFVIRNTGDAPLIIQQIRPSCGCTAANASTPTIQPGKSGEIKVTFDSANFTGSVTKNVAIDTNDPKSPTYTLSLTGNIHAELQVNPRQLDLGQIKVGSSSASTITVSNNGTRAVRIISAKAQVPQITAEVKKSQLKPGESAAIHISVTPKATDRIISGYVTIVTDSPRKPEIVVPVYGSPIR